MRKADAAEWILSLTTTPERAASTAGDLTQESEARGTAWFWISLLKTTMSLVWRTLAGRPHHMAGLAFRACIVGALYLAFFIAIAMAMRFVLMNTFGVSVNATLGYAAIMTRFVVMTSHFQMGQWLAQRTQGRELAAGIATILMELALLILYFGVQALTSNPTPGLAAGSHNSLYPNPVHVAISLIALLAGVVVAHRPARLTFSQ